MGVGWGVGGGGRGQVKSKGSSSQNLDAEPLTAAGCSDGRVGRWAPVPQ